MENRRQTYRHPFDPQDPIRAELCRPGQRGAIVCELLDLSLGGLRGWLRNPADTFQVGDTVVIRLIDRNTEASQETPPVLRGQIVHLKQDGEDWQCGIRFLPSADPRVNEQIERALSRFLLAEQRRLRRKQLE